MGSSIRAGIQHLLAIGENVPVAVLMTCDQPFVDATTIRGLIAGQTETKKPIVASSYANILGVPALFERNLFEELLRIEEFAGAKAIILSHPEQVAAVPLPEGKIDIDTMKDRRMIERNDDSQVTACRQRIS